MYPPLLPLSLPAARRDSARAGAQLTPAPENVGRRTRGRAAANKDIASMVASLSSGAARSAPSFPSSVPHALPRPESARTDGGVLVPKILFLALCSPTANPRKPAQSATFTQVSSSREGFCRNTRACDGPASAVSHFRAIHSLAMTSSKEMQQFSRPLTYHRSPLTNSSATGLLGRQAHARTNSHCLLTGSLNTNHRVTRRKSVTNTGPNVAAFTAAALNVAAAKGESSAAMPIAAGDRRHPMSKARVYSLPSPPASFPIHRSVPESKESAIDDEAIELSDDEGSAKDQKAHVRRASDGQPLLKDGKKSNRIEVRCEKCGKGYKHSSCLTKHLWEHTPGWSYTSKLLISKHQQVQLLEAASVLVAMNGKESSVTPPDSTKDSASELDSSSPAGSGYSEADEGQGSADTTPPPAISFGASPYRDTRLGVAGDVSDNRQSTSLKSSLLTETGFAGTVLGLGDRRQTSFERRPPSSGANRTGQDDRDLAAAVELLSCSFGSNNGSNGTLTLPIDAPPVPPVPAQYLDQATFLASTGFFNSFPSRQPESFTRGELQQSSIDVKMEDSGEDDDFDMQSHARSDEDDGIFGRMEE